MKVVDILAAHPEIDERLHGPAVAENWAPPECPTYGNTHVRMKWADVLTAHPEIRERESPA